MLQNLFSLRQFRLTKCRFFKHKTTPYTILELGRDFRIEKDHDNLTNRLLHTSDAEGPPVTDFPGRVRPFAKHNSS